MQSEGVTIIYAFPILGLAALILTAAAGVLVYFFAYRRHINNTLVHNCDEASPARTKPARRMPSVGTVMLVICAVVLGGFMIYVTAELSDLKEQVSDINERINNMSWNIPNQMQNYVDQALREQNSLVTSAYYELGALDTATNRAEIKFTVVPKNTSADAALSLSVGGETTELEHKGGGIYEGKMMIDVFRAYDEAILMISDSAGQRTQVIYELAPDLLWQSYLPSILGAVTQYYENSSTDRCKAGITVVVYDPEYDGGHKFTSVRLIAEVDGVPVYEKEVLPMLSAPNNSAEVLMDAERPSYGNWTMSVYILATDNVGYTYKSVIESYSFVDGGDWGMGTVTPDEMLSITDKNGNILYNGWK